MKKLIFLFSLVIFSLFLFSCEAEPQGVIVELTEESSELAGDVVEEVAESAEEVAVEVTETVDSEEVTETDTEGSDEASETAEAGEVVDGTETSDSEETNETEEVVVEEDPVTVVEIIDEGYSPDSLTIAAGTTVRFKNARVDAYNEAEIYGLRTHSDIRSDRLDIGDSWEYTFTEAGDYEFIDLFVTVYTLKVTVE